MRPRSYRKFVGDFETTVYKGQQHTEVWASALVELYTEDVVILHSLPDTFEYLKSLNENIILYYHNLKFDGAFWISYLLTELHMKQAYTLIQEEPQLQVKWLKDSEMPNNSFKYSISDMGQWYTITIKLKDVIIELRDSLKLLPFSVKKIGDNFGTKHKKLDMEYVGFRYAGCEITAEEKEYIANDVLVVKEALEIMEEQGHNSLTIGSCCLTEFKKIIGKYDYNILFPDLYEIKIDKELYGSETAGEYIHKSYKGGWCYLVEGKENKIYEHGTTADVNSLYPSMMSSESGNYYPHGKPYFWKGEIPEIAKGQGKYYFVRIKTRFYIKPDKLPFIQIKDSFEYKRNEMLKTSDIKGTDGKDYAFIENKDGTIRSTAVTLTLTMIDFQLLKEHYELVDFEILDGCWFYAQQGLFDMYIEKYKKIKLENKGAIRELAKLFLNNLYGKLASSKCSSFKVAYEKEDHSIGFKSVLEFDKKAGYIPCGSAITSYARNFTIRSAQANYHGVDNPGFIYADTDSIHCDLPPESIEGITVHDKNFCCWKLESCWDKAIFVRQKTYIEHITHENLEEIEDPYYNIKCAGMPDKCKKLLNYSMVGVSEEQLKEMNEEEQKFVKVKRTMNDFKVGLIVPDKLMPKRISGGVVLQETTYEMR